MNAWLRNLLSAVLVVCACILAPPGQGRAQLISLKTVPIPSGEQFLVYPSTMLGMGGAFITTEDPLVDPFVNPAKGARITTATLFAVPTFYTVTDDMGAGRTLSTGGLFGGGRFFGGGLFAIQQIDAPPQNRGFIPGATTGGNLFGGDPNNRYVHGVAGLRFPAVGISIGAAILDASLEAMDGVQHLYAGSSRIIQRGGLTDYRFGMLKDLTGGGRIEAVLVHDRVDMEHDVTFVDFLWDPATQQQTTQTRFENNLSRTRTTGLHLGIVHPLEAGWKAGGILTFNRKQHPKIPNYRVIGVRPIPRDPGNSTAYDIGVGVSRRNGGALFAMDLIYQPARSNTWAEAEGEVQGQNGVVIPHGGKTVQNWFEFDNIRFGIGTGREGNMGSWQIGLALVAYRYSLYQEDYVQQAARDANGSWTEWVPSWSATLKLGGGFDLRYSGRLTMKGFPDELFPDLGGDAVLVSPPAPSDDILVAVTGPVNLPDYATFTTQFSLTLPIRRPAPRTVSASR